MPSQISEPATVSPEAAENLKSVYARIDAARRSAIAPAADIRLIAVTKTHPAERILPVLDAGHRIFGENRVHEAKSKWPELKTRYPGIELHLIGALQTNKVREAVALFDVVHSLDREHLAEVLKTELEKSQRAVRLLVQVNTAQEPQKGGIAPPQVAGFVRHCRDELLLPVVGLMCIPPVDEEPALHFALLRKLGSESGLEFLSMGMSEDFETAIRFGATHVRIGTAIFGRRETY